MTSRTGSLMLRPAALALAASLLIGCATAPSEPRLVTVCPPIVEYDVTVRNQVIVELDLLPEPSAIEGMLRDYAVLRDQIRICRERV